MGREFKYPVPFILREPGNFPGCGSPDTRTIIGAANVAAQSEVSKNQANLHSDKMQGVPPGDPESGKGSPCRCPAIQTRPREPEHSPVILNAAKKHSFAAQTVSHAQMGNFEALQMSCALGAMHSFISQLQGDRGKFRF